MDYVRPVEALIPGAQGKILAACLRSSEPLTMRALARLAAVSPNQATVVLNHLEELGLVHRQPAGRALIVTLVDESPVIEALREVAALRERTLFRWRERARDIRPRPTTLAVYGSWARGEARPGSDVDVVVVIPADVPIRRSATRPLEQARAPEGIPSWCGMPRRRSGSRMFHLDAESLRRGRPRWSVEDPPGAGGSDARRRAVGRGAGCRGA